MILGLGVDVVHIKRLRHWQGIPGIFDRFFHPQELLDSKKRGDSAVLSLSARFAAKEAFGKALGTGLSGINLKDIQVINNFNGKPDIKLFGAALKSFKEIGGKKLFISLTHEKDSAIAVVIIEGNI